MTDQSTAVSVVVDIDGCELTYKSPSAQSGGPSVQLALPDSAGRLRAARGVTKPISEPHNVGSGHSIDGHYSSAVCWLAGQDKETISVPDAEQTETTSPAPDLCIANRTLDLCSEGKAKTCNDLTQINCSGRL